MYNRSSRWLIQHFSRFNRSSFTVSKLLREKSLLPTSSTVSECTNCQIKKQKPQQRAKSPQSIPNGASQPTDLCHVSPMHHSNVIVSTRAASIPLMLLPSTYTIETVSHPPQLVNTLGPPRCTYPLRPAQPYLHALHTIHHTTRWIQKPHKPSASVW